MTSLVYISDINFAISLSNNEVSIIYSDWKPFEENVGLKKMKNESYLKINSELFEIYHMIYVHRNAAKSASSLSNSIP